MRGYTSSRGPTRCCKLDLQTMVESKSLIESLKESGNDNDDQIEDVWILSLCFCYPVPSTEESTLRKKHSIEIYIVSKFSERFGIREFLCEELIINMYNTQEFESIEIFRKRIRTKFSEWTYMNNNYSVCDMMVFISR